MQLFRNQTPFDGMLAGLHTVEHVHAYLKDIRHACCRVSN